MCPRLPMSMAPPSQTELPPSSPAPRPMTASLMVRPPHGTQAPHQHPVKGRASACCSPAQAPAVPFLVREEKFRGQESRAQPPLTFCPSAAPGPTFRSESQAQMLLSTASHGLCPCDLGVAGSFPGVRPHVSSWEGSFLRTPLSRPPPVGPFPAPSEPWHMTLYLLQVCDLSP